nr:pullulanase 1, chloroplastic [Tanacetum cinerariifolium]
MKGDPTGEYRSDLVWLSGDRKRTFLVNLDSDYVKPQKWDNLVDEKPDIADFADISIYELHIRDFSANDSYLAFTYEESAGVLHLKKLSDAGLTHIHLLPTFQFGDVEDEKEKWKFVDMEMLESLPPDSAEQQEYITAIQNEDGFNWGYNPLLWGVPKGSYATNPNGPYRITEFRNMVQEVRALIYNGPYAVEPLEIVQLIESNGVWSVSGPRSWEGCYYVYEVSVYHPTTLRIEKCIANDPYARGLSGDRKRTFLVNLDSNYVKPQKWDNLVDEKPDIADFADISIYELHIRDFRYGEGWDFGEVANNGRWINASQSNLAGSGIGSFNDRIRDAVLGGSPFGHPLQQGFLTGLSLQIDGFRFDLMGHMMKSTMMRAKSVLESLSRDKDGVDGSSIFLYGEGWDFGEVANNGRGINASQSNLAGSGIGSFNDRIRDAVLGGSPFGHPLQQGFLTGLSLQPNGHDHGTEANAARILAISKDHIQVGMAANLKEFVLTNCDGHEVKGSEILTYGGSPVAYASQPVETINYASAHDNETLFDIISLKTPMELSVDERCRMNHLATSIIALSQVTIFSYMNHVTFWV